MFAQYMASTLPALHAGSQTLSRIGGRKLGNATSAHQAAMLARLSGSTSLGCQTQSRSTAAKKAAC
jgi:hypothetical protein